MAHSNFQEELVVNKADDMGPEETTHVQPKGAAELGSENGHGMPQYVDGGVNPVLESEEKSKGQWFAYLKTKQFWVAMILGQGKPQPSPT